MDSTKVSQLLSWIEALREGKCSAVELESFISIVSISFDQTMLLRPPKDRDKEYRSNAGHNKELSALAVRLYNKSKTSLDSGTTLIAAAPDRERLRTSQLLIKCIASWMLYCYCSSAIGSISLVIRLLCRCAKDLHDINEDKRAVALTFLEAAFGLWDRIDPSVAATALSAQEHQELLIAMHNGLLLYALTLAAPSSVSYSIFSTSSSSSSAFSSAAVSVAAIGLSNEENESRFARLFRAITKCRSQLQQLPFSFKAQFIEAVIAIAARFTEESDFQNAIALYRTAAEPISLALAKSRSSSPSRPASTTTFASAEEIANHKLGRNYISILLAVSFCQSELNQFDQALQTLSAIEGFKSASSSNELNDIGIGVENLEVSIAIAKLSVFVKQHDWLACFQCIQPVLLAGSFAQCCTCLWTLLENGIGSCRDVMDRLSSLFHILSNKCERLGAGLNFKLFKLLCAMSFNMEALLTPIISPKADDRQQRQQPQQQQQQVQDQILIAYISVLLSDLAKLDADKYTDSDTFAGNFECSSSRSNNNYNVTQLMANVNCWIAKRIQHLRQAQRWKLVVNWTSVFDLWLQSCPRSVPPIVVGECLLALVRLHLCEAYIHLRGFDEAVRAALSGAVASVAFHLQSKKGMINISSENVDTSAHAVWNKALVMSFKAVLLQRGCVDAIAILLSMRNYPLPAESVLGTVLTSTTCEAVLQFQQMLIDSNILYKDSIRFDMYADCAKGMSEWLHELLLCASTSRDLSTQPYSNEAHEGEYPSATQVLLQLWLQYFVQCRCWRLQQAPTARTSSGGSGRGQQERFMSVLTELVHQYHYKQLEQMLEAGKVAQVGTDKWFSSVMSVGEISVDSGAGVSRRSASKHQRALSANRQQSMAPVTATTSTQVVKEQAMAGRKEEHLDEFSLVDCLLSLNRPDKGSIALRGGRQGSYGDSDATASVAAMIVEDHAQAQEMTQQSSDHATDPAVADPIADVDADAVVADQTNQPLEIVLGIIDSFALAIDLFWSLEKDCEADVSNSIGTSDEYKHLASIAWNCGLLFANARVNATESQKMHSSSNPPIYFISSTDIQSFSSAALLFEIADQFFKRWGQSANNKAKPSNSHSSSSSSSSSSSNISNEARDYRCLCMAMAASFRLDIDTKIQELPGSSFDGEEAERGNEFGIANLILAELAQAETEGVAKAPSTAFEQYNLEMIHFDLKRFSSILRSVPNSNDINHMKNCSLVTLLSLAVACKTSVSATRQYIQDHSADLLQLPPDLLMQAANLASRERRGGSIDATRSLLHLCLQACVRASHDGASASRALYADNIKRMGHIYCRLIEISSSRNQCIETIEEFSQLILSSQQSMSSASLSCSSIGQPTLQLFELLGDDIDHVIALAYNNAVTLFELEDYALAERFLRQSIVLLSYATPRASAWQQNIQTLREALKKELDSARGMFASMHTI